MINGKHPSKAQALIMLRMAEILRIAVDEVVWDLAWRD
jgi:hypothetical protein